MVRPGAHHELFGQLIDCADSVRPQVEVMVRSGKSIADMKLATSDNDTRTSLALRIFCVLQSEGLVPLADINDDTVGEVMRMAPLYSTLVAHDMADTSHGFSTIRVADSIAAIRT